MNFIDEEIIEMTKHARDKKRAENLENNWLHTDIVQAIKDGQLRMEEEVIEFTRVGFYDNQIQMSMPKTFELMEQDLMTLKYPSSQRPDYIYTSESTSVNITMKMMQQQLKAEELEDFAHVMRNMLQRMQPAAKMMDFDTNEINGAQISYFDFITPALDSDIYNVMFLFMVGEQVAVGSFNCLKKEMSMWQPLAYGMMETIVIENTVDVEGVV